jgi:hypothetical protein
MRNVVLCLVMIALSAAAWTAPARAQTAAPLTGADFDLQLFVADSSGNATTPLDANALSTYFSQHRCACPANLLAGVDLNATGQSGIGTSTVTIQLMVGSGCDDAATAAAACTPLGTVVTLTADQASGNQSFGTAAIYSRAQAQAGVTSCAALTATSTALWAIVRQDGVLLSTQPSLPISVTAATIGAPSAPSALSADQGLLVKWTAPADTSSLAGYQVLCSPGRTPAIAAAFDSCGTAAAATADTLGTNDPTLICSKKVAPTPTSILLDGLINGTSYNVAVVAIDSSGGVSLSSTITAGMPAPTLGFFDVYGDKGGTAQAGCSMATAAGPGAPPRSTALAATALGIMWLSAAARPRRRGRRSAPRRRRRRRCAGRWAIGRAALLLVSAPVLLGSRAARAQDYDQLMREGHAGDESQTGESPRGWNLELRFGPYRPNVDSEFADRGSPERPFQQVFSSSRRLISELEIDHQLSHRWGTWSVGLGVGYYNASAPALSPDGVTATGDQTTLRIIPLSISGVYRADILPRLTGLPFVPYAKAGLDYALWSSQRTGAGHDYQGGTPGWHAAGGLAINLDFLDPDGARMLDHESGVNHTAIFFEWRYAALDGFGSSSRLRVGDNSWLAGLMLEF